MLKTLLFSIFFGGYVHVSLQEQSTSGVRLARSYHLFRRYGLRRLSLAAGSESPSFTTGTWLWCDRDELETGLVGGTQLQRRVAKAPTGFRQEHGCFVSGLHPRSPVSLH